MQIKKIIFIAFSIALPLFTLAQKGVEEILKELSETISSYKCLYFEYTMKAEDVHLATSEMQDGKVLMKGNKYRLSTTKGVDLYNDGTTQWQYLKDNNEVMISLSDSTSDVITNPLGFIMGDKKEFKQKLKGEVIEDDLNLVEIDFYPKDIKVPYSYIRVRINEKKRIPFSIKYMGKDGMNYTIKIKNYTPDIEMPKDEEFVFESSKYPDIEIVDLRE
ncbi:MAG: outer membrane lipoprotein carrier protein LolA [Prevotellaceae bacterium]|jgi:outer membrane lipoprotein-sorting protein|nr:outer membrane lipoprotein carrier protein LolA [Prevotellaceae bacterium]